MPDHATNFVQKWWLSGGLVCLVGLAKDLGSASGGAIFNLVFEQASAHLEVELIKTGPKFVCKVCEP